MALNLDNPDAAREERKQAREAMMAQFNTPESKAAREQAREAELVAFNTPEAQAAREERKQAREAMMATMRVARNNPDTPA